MEMITKPCVACGSSVTRYASVKAWLCVKHSTQYNSRKSYASMKCSLGYWPWDRKCVDCGKDAAVFDHRDYTKPKEVEPVCRGCNVKRGPGAWMTYEGKFISAKKMGGKLERGGKR